MRVFCLFCHVQCRETTGVWWIASTLVHLISVLSQSVRSWNENRSDFRVKTQWWVQSQSFATSVLINHLCTLYLTTNILSTPGKVQLGCMNLKSAGWQRWRKSITYKHMILSYDTIRYDTIGEFNVDWKAEYSALSSTRSQKKKLKQPTPVPL